MNVLHDGVLKSGRQAEWVFYVFHGKQCRRRYVLPCDPRTPRQLRSRAALTAASKSWSHSSQLTEQQRLAWNAAGAKIQSHPRLSQSGPLTGQQHFVGRNCSGSAGREEMLWEPQEGKAERRRKKCRIQRTMRRFHSSSASNSKNCATLLEDSPGLPRSC